jgi:hypothetical protein
VKAAGAGNVRVWEPSQVAVPARAATG